MLVYAHVAGSVYRVFREMTKMEKQATVNIVDAVKAMNGYAALQESVERMNQKKGELRLVIVPFIKANMGKDKWTKQLNKQVKDAIESIPVGLCSDKVGLLGVIKTCCEYGIMPTTVNANRLRKLNKTWTTVDGKIIPNRYEKVHAEKPTPSLTEAEAEKIVDKQIENMEKAHEKQAGARLDKMANVLDLATMTTPTPEAPIAASTKAVTPQKAAVKGEIPRPNVSSSDEPLSAREHCAILLDQLFKNDAFRSEFAPILATMLDSNVGIVTRCLVESRDLFCKGGK